MTIRKQLCIQAVIVVCMLITTSICFAKAADPALSIDANKIKNHFDGSDGLNNEGFTYEHFRYRINDNNEIIITKFGFDLNVPVDNVIIPNEIDGRRVVGADRNIFYDYDHSYLYEYKIKNIVCSDYMETVDMQSFNGAEELETITLGKYTNLFKLVGYDVSGDNLLGHFGKYKILLPSDAKYLKIVKSALYSKDGSVLYRSSFATKKCKTFRISDNTKRIYKYAFRCSSFHTIKFGKRVEKIDKGTIQYSSINTIKVPEKNRKKLLKVLGKSGITKKYRKKWHIRVITY